MSTNLTFVPAVRSATKLRAGLFGPAGSGKTWTSLAFAFALTDKVAVIDTDYGKSQLYQGINGWNFSINPPQKFSPKSLVELITVAETEGFEALVVDNLSAYWSGEDGMLEQVDKRASNADPRTGWSAVRPDERELIKKILSANLHIIVTMNAKTEYVRALDEKTGKPTMNRVGLKPEQRDNIEGQFDVVFSLDEENTLRTVKTRVPPLNHAVIPQPTGDVAVQAAEWLVDGEHTPTPEDFRNRALRSGHTRDTMLALYNEVKTAGMLHTAVTDPNGGTQPLGGFITRLGKEIQTAQGQPHRGAAPAANSTTDRDPVPISTVMNNLNLSRADEMNLAEQTAFIAESLDGIQAQLDSDKAEPGQLSEIAEALAELRDMTSDSELSERAEAIGCIVSTMQQDRDTPAVA